MQIRISGQAELDHKIQTGSDDQDTPYGKKLHLVKERPFLLCLKLRVTGLFCAPAKFALTQRTFAKISGDINLAIRTTSHLITSVALTVMSTPDSDRQRTKFFTTPVFAYASETPKVRFSP